MNTKISDAAVEAACVSVYVDYGICSAEQKTECREEMRAALAAALPHLAADAVAVAEAVAEAVVTYCGRRLTPEGARECWGVLAEGVEDLPRNTKLYAAPPAQAIDLEQLQRWGLGTVYFYGDEKEDMVEMAGGWFVLFDDVQALIDSQRTAGPSS